LSFGILVVLVEAVVEAEVAVEEEVVEAEVAVEEEVVEAGVVETEAAVEGTARKATHKTASSQVGC
jgi:hypothetical protein